MIRPKGKALKIAKESVPGLSRWALVKSQADTKVRPDYEELKNQSNSNRFGYSKGRAS